MASALLIGFMLAAGAHADEKLAQSSGCTVCHAVDKKLVGPTYKEIATKYASDKNAEAILVKSTRAGSQGVWGTIPMPPSPHVKEEDAQTIVRWILSLK